MTDVFQECRALVSARDVAEYYGFTPNRAGYICCPFHNERTPSLKLFPNGGWYCFGCGKGGSSIDFVSRLLDLKPVEAVKRLNADFALSLPLHRKPTPAEAAAARRRMEISRAHKQFEAWRESFASKLCAAYRVAHVALQGIEAPEDLDRLSEREALAIRWQPCFEHWADALSDGTPEEQMQIYRERREITRWIEKVLSSTPMRSSVA